MKRYCYTFIKEDLNKKMVWVGGPRQVGKTVLSRMLCKHAFKRGQYFNWDADEDRKAMLEKKWQVDSSLIVFDELHKYAHWKRWLKGVYDTKPQGQQYLVTGSARLDVYRRGGDSLMGRYHYWRLHPITLDELPDGMNAIEGYKRLMQLGGFPEPFLQNDLREANRWRKERFDRIVQEDIRDLSPVHQLRLLQLFIEALRERVGSLVVLSNVARDLEISPITAKSWLSLVERLYLVFTVYPLVRNVPRSILKPPKVFFYDNADTVDKTSARLENLVATTLLKRLQFIEDFYGHRCSLHYIRDKEGREVDFVTLVNGQVEELIEVKWRDTSISRGLKYYNERLKPKRAVQIVGELSRAYDDNGVRVTSPIDYFISPPWSEAVY